MHASHHENVGNLHGSNLGELVTLTVAQYRAPPRFKQLACRTYRSPAFLFVVAPFFLCFIQYRLPVGLMRRDRRYWISSPGINLFIGLGLYTLYFGYGWAPPHLDISTQHAVYRFCRCLDILRSSSI